MNLTQVTVVAMTVVASVATSVFAAQLPGRGSAAVEFDAAPRSPQPSVDQVAALVNAMMGKINGVVYQLTTEARKSA
jgi:hypothetical protein